MPIPKELLKKERGVGVADIFRCCYIAIAASLYKSDISNDEDVYCLAPACSSLRLPSLFRYPILSSTPMFRVITPRSNG